jgi:hypothetical protein
MVAWCALPPFSRNRTQRRRFCTNTSSNFHGERRADACEQKHHEADQGAVAQAGRRRRIDAVEELASLGGFQNRRLAGLHDMLRTVHRYGRVHLHDLADDKSIEQATDRDCLTVCASIHVATCSGAICASDGTPASGAPRKEVGDGAAVRPPGVCRLRIAAAKNSRKHHCSF